MNKITNRGNNYAVSEVVGTVLLLVISITIFSSVYISLSTVDLGESTPSVHVTASLNDTTLTLEHCGGESLENDTKVVLRNENNEVEKIKIDKYLDEDEEENNVWDIGEKVVIDVSDNFPFSRYEKLSVQVVDSNSRYTMMIADLKEERHSDLKIFVKDEKIEGETLWWINTTVTNLGPSEAENVVVEIPLSPGLKFEGNSEDSDGSFNDGTGLWNVGSISEGVSKKLNIKVNLSAEVNPSAQLAIVLDGTMESGYFSDVLTGLSDALNMSTIPHNGQIEMTVIQYGAIDDEDYDGDARVEEYGGGKSWVVDESNYENVADFMVNEIDRMGAGSSLDYAVPMSSGVKLARKTLENRYNVINQPEQRQVIVLIASHTPNCYVEGSHTGVEAKKFQLADHQYDIGKADAVLKRDNLLDALKMHDRFEYPEGPDEIDLAIIDGETSLEKLIYSWRWSLYHLVFPQPGYEYPEGRGYPEDAGWVLNITTSSMDLSDSIKDMFRPIFQLKRDIPIRIISSKYSDPNPENDLSSVSISVLPEER
ncbi:MAG: type IV pilin [Candidatus Thermoplasmatota archaeon]